MKRISIPSYITGVPVDPVEFDRDTICIEDDGVEFMIGTAASERDPMSVRQFHGNFSVPQFRRLIKAMVASLCGEGSHELDIAISVPLPAMQGFRKEPGSIELSETQLEEAKKSLSEFKFRKGSTKSPQQVCKVNLSKVSVFYETQAVQMVIPKQLKSYALWQGGHGDLQQIVFVDGKPKFDAHIHVKGLVGALEIFARLAGHSTADAESGWRNNRLTKPGGMNGDEYSEDEVLELKKKALKEYFGTLVTKLLNANVPYETRVKNIILSGGMAKDKLSVSILKDEIGSRYSLHTIDNLPVKDERADDPSFTCVNGMLSVHKMALDAGNSFLKGAYNA